MLYTKYSTLLVQPILGKIFLAKSYVIIKTLLTLQSTAKPLSMTFKSNKHNVIIYLYKKF